MRYLLALLMLLLLAGEAQAQVTVVNVCGTLPQSYAPGTTRNTTVDINGNLCTSASVTATSTVTGWPTTQTTGTPLAVTTTSGAGPLPAGTVVIASNTSTTTPVYCSLGASATVNAQLIAPSSWLGFTVGGNTQLACITSSGTATVNLAGGSGLPTGAGGGGGGGGTGGAVTQSGIWNMRLQDGSGNAIGSTTGSLNVDCIAGCTGGGGGGTSSNFNNTFPPAGTAIGVKNGANMVNLTADGSNNLNVNIAAGLLPPGNAVMGSSTPVTWAIDQVPIKASSTSVIAPSTTPAGVLMRGAPAYVLALELGNIGSTPAYLKLYNKATAPTCGTDTPVKRLIIPAAATAANGAGSNITFAAGVYFNTGLGYCITGGLADSDTTAVAANTVLVNIDWQ